jgi:hypothetical protein
MQHMKIIDGSAVHMHCAHALCGSSLERCIQSVAQHQVRCRARCRLVGSQCLTELEFWASKRNQVQAAQTSLAGPQATGINTALLSFLNAPRDSQTGKISITISPELEQQIFAETAGLRAAYVASVPHRRSRPEFYAEFFKMLNNRVERRRKKAAGAFLSGQHALLQTVHTVLPIVEASVPRRSCQCFLRLCPSTVSDSFVELCRSGSISISLCMHAGIRVNVCCEGIPGGTKASAEAGLLLSWRT